MKPVLTADMTAGMGLDAATLDALKAKAQRSPREALAAAATQFEALFVQQLLKSMREALPQDGTMSSDSMRAYTAMFDSQLAQEIAKRGLGLGKMLERQLSSAVSRTEKPAGAAQASSADPTTSATTGIGARQPAAKPSAAPTSAPAADSSGSALDVPHHVKAFIDAMRPHAEAAARMIGIPANLLLAQAGLETGWGRHQPQGTDGTASHNLFGVKAGARWNGAVALSSTTEYVAGALTRTVEKFRSYASYTDAFADFAKLLTGNTRYAGAVANAHDAAAYARGLQQGGYATDPHYAAKLTRAISMVASHDPAAPVSQVSAGIADKRLNHA